MTNNNILIKCKNCKNAEGDNKKYPYSKTNIELLDKIIEMMDWKVIECPICGKLGLEKHKDEF